ncbi:hypothetical protein SGPA1_21910 [Streptomyces misionensis JCM 4497]
MSQVCPAAAHDGAGYERLVTPDSGNGRPEPGRRAQRRILVQVVPVSGRQPTGRCVS